MYIFCGFQLEDDVRCLSSEHNVVAAVPTVVFDENDDEPATSPYFPPSLSTANPVRSDLQGIINNHLCY